jgi:hypothetical protein
MGFIPTLTLGQAKDAVEACNEMADLRQKARQSFQPGVELVVEALELFPSDTSQLSEGREP